MSAVLFLGGVQMMMLGFVGLYVGAIFRDSKRRPQYVVKEVLRK
jgi:dolichol-phosphate mannosyltransferase